LYCRNSELSIEAHLNSRCRQSIYLLLFSLTLMQVLAQVSAAQTTVVDAALLSKASAGDAAAEVAAGNAYSAGNGAAREPGQLAADYEQAAAWYRRAADQGNTAAQVHLADFYRDGRGVARNMAQAAAWYRKAADQGDAGAQGTLGLLYSVGMGVERDDVEAYYWLCLASSEKGPNQAKYLTNRQSVGEHITTDQQAAVAARVAAWQAAHPHPAK
jgi:TPR repeat protein